MRSAFFDKVRPCLLPTAVTLALVLLVTLSDKVRKNTPHEKFNRIRLGMEAKQVQQMLGRAPDSGLPPSAWEQSWSFDESTIVIDLDRNNEVIGKRLYRTHRPTSVFPVKTAPRAKGF